LQKSKVSELFGIALNDFQKLLPGLKTGLCRAPPASPHIGMLRSNMPMW
jgi:hypothetical protein